MFHGSYSKNKSGTFFIETVHLSQETSLTATGRHVH